MFWLWGNGEWGEVWVIANKWIGIWTLLVPIEWLIKLIKDDKDAEIYDWSDVVFGR